MNLNVGIELNDKSRYLIFSKTMGVSRSSSGLWMLEIWLRARRSFWRFGRRETGRMEEILTNMLRSSFSSVSDWVRIFVIGVPPISWGMEDSRLRDRSRVWREGKRGRIMASSSHESRVSSSSREVILSNPVPREPSSLSTSALTSNKENLLPLMRRERNLGRPRQIASTLCSDSNRFRERLRSSISRPEP